MNVIHFMRKIKQKNTLHKIIHKKNIDKAT